ncbi:DNA repair protein RecO [Actinotignum urinale]|uniref:DNA repair protein RecO n=1 Tax=Actinotignum urinale TaxID=190146 RepID=A0ABU5G7Q5_9ACTO|nr:DNA repair protein RecO [Actinotignum urinale]MDY5128783.1 DNA repair protein RecO [Actinotignum urinale]MDY5133357.1 DNA repair protein RecO [Actinotignum urinale]MDY5152095.1 DNA repair protein RecO [Actinotignum urinale]MDY5160205.1 DNA repair protein RecO [Actinotignum urinale]WIK58918.1 DNA repair protein RecO [Actinotignum urinale]
MKLYSDTAAVLRTHDLGEADRIITFITHRHGIVRAVAKGVRRTKSRFGARLEPFSLVNVQLYRGKSLDIVTEVEGLHHFGRVISANYEAYTCAYAMAETAEKLGAEQEEDRPAYRLFAGALASLARQEHAPELIMYSYFLRALALAGWAIALDSCALCGGTSHLQAFHVQSGGMVCENCASQNSSYLNEESVMLLRGLAHGKWEDVDNASPMSIHIVTTLVKQYVQWHMERRIRSLDLVEESS